jgi:hypothetical protein
MSNSTQLLLVIMAIVPSIKLNRVEFQVFLPVELIQHTISETSQFLHTDGLLLLFNQASESCFPPPSFKQPHDTVASKTLPSSIGTNDDATIGHGNDDTSI